MEKEELISKLKANVGNTNLSERTFSEYVDNIIPTDGAEIDDAFIERHSGILKSVAGQMRADISSALSKALPEEVQRYLEKNPAYIEEYVKKHPLKPIEPPKEDEKYVAIEKQLKELQETLNNQEKEKVLNSLRQSATKKLSESGVSVNNGIWDDAINDITIPEGATVDDVYTLAKEKYDEKCKKYSFTGGKPNASGGNGGDDTKDKFVSDYFARKWKKK